MTKQKESSGKQQKQESKAQRNKKPEQQEELQMERQPEKISAEKVRETAVNPTDASPAALQAVQRSYGNQYLQRMAQRQQGERSAPNVPKLTTRNGRLQPKLTVNDPDDQYEKEAEAVSEKVSRAPEHTPPVGGSDGGGSGSGGNGGNGSDGGGNDGQAANAVGKLNPQRQAVTANASHQGTATSTGSVQAVHRSVPTQLRGKLFDSAQRAEAPEIDEEAGSDMLSKAPPEHVPNIGIDGGTGEVQRSDVGYDQHSGAVNSDIESTISSKSSGGGQPLSDPVRNKMEGHMGSDFSGVKVHNDSDSHSLNRSLNARAFTTGNNIFFSKNEYQPNTQSGQKLIAHELTHVVQQGAAPKKAQRTEAAEEEVQREEAAPEEEMAQRNEALEEEVQMRRETAVSRAMLQREEQKTAESQSANSTVSGELSKAGPHHQAVSNIISPMLARSPLTIQRDDKEKEAERKDMKEKMAKGKDKASSKKADKQSKKDEKKEKGAEGNKKKVGGKLRQPDPEPNPKIRQPKKVESKGKVNTEESERPEVQGETGSLGWPPTKHNLLPDWDGETKKFENFKNGDFASLGVDLSELEGDTTGLDSAITVDDPEVRKQMVQDALAGGLGGDGDLVSDKNMALATITDAIPFAGQLMSASKFLTEGPGAWWESTSEGFKNAAANIGSAWKGMGEGSGWNRAASALEFIIGIMEMINNILQFVSIVALIVLIVLGIILGIGTALMATVFLAGVGASMVGFASPYIPIAAKVLAIIAMVMVHINLFIRFLREIVIAFRIIDILYFESDPDKLMERQAKLAGHVSGQNQAAHESITPGISKDEEKDPNEGLIGADELEEPLVADPSIERVNRMGDGEKQDYKTAWMQKYGIRSTADDVRDSLMSEDVEPPPLIEFGADKENDVITKVDRNAIAIIELKKQRLGLEGQKQETDQAREVAANQKEIIGNARDSVASDQETMDVHQKDIKKKQDKQDELKSTTEETGGKGKESGNESLQVKGLAGIILKLLKPLMPAMSKAGENVDGEKKKQTEKGGEQGVQATDSAVDSAKMGSAEADSRKAQTKKTEMEAKQSAQTAEATAVFLEDQEGQVDEGLNELEAHSEDLGTTIGSVASEEERLVQERTEALNEAVTWMEEWRARRMEIFSAMEEKLEERLPGEKEEEEGEEDKKAKWDIYDDQADQGELEGDYFSAGMNTGETEEGEEEFAI